MISCFEIGTTNWDSGLQEEALSALEDGKILVLPNFGFALSAEESKFLDPKAFDLKVKSIKYNAKEKRVWGVDLANLDVISELMEKYTKFSINLVKNLLTFYKDGIEIGNSSFRPIEAENRKQSKRHDDTRLHVDAFPSRPVHGMRLLRVFTNVNPEGKPRIWNAGETFNAVLERFLPKISPPLPFSASIMKALRITKSLRTEYDHYMLKLHDAMKLDDHYQNMVQKERLEFSAGSVWICFSDKTSHAALSGRGLLEQTIYLPVDKMKNSEKSPLRILEKQLGKKLI